MGKKKGMLLVTVFLTVIIFTSFFGLPPYNIRCIQAANMLFHLDFENGFTADGSKNPVNSSIYWPTLVTGMDGYGARFDDGKVLQYATSGSFNSSQGAISMWIKTPIDGCGSEGERRFLFTEDGKKGQDLTMWLVGQVGMRMHTNASTSTGEAVAYCDTYMPHTWRQDEWHHIVYNWDSSNNQKPLWCYVDGMPSNYVVGGTGTYSFLNREWVAGNNPNFLLGAMDAIGTEAWGGVIDEIKIFSGTLSDTEVLTEFSIHGTRKVQITTFEPNLFTEKAEDLRLKFDNQTALSVNLSPTYEVKDRQNQTVASGNLKSIYLSAGESSYITLSGLTLPDVGDYALIVSFDSEQRILNLRGLPQTETTGVSEQLTLVDSVDATQSVNGVDRVQIGTATVVNWSQGNYLEAGSNMFDRVALKFTVNNLGIPHLIRLRYPDDKARDMEVLVNRLNDYSETYDKQCHLGYLTGVEYPISNSMVEQEFMLWPESLENVLIFSTYDDGCPAAVAGFDVYEYITGPTAAGIYPFQGSVPARQIGIFYEDPVMHRNFDADALFPGFDVAVTRQLDFMESAGQGVFSYPVAWYRGPTYPFSDTEPSSPIPSGRPHTSDFVQYLLKRLEARKMQFVGQLQIHDLPSLCKGTVVNDIADVVAGNETFLSVNNNNALNLKGSHKYDNCYNPLSAEVSGAVNNIVDELLFRYGDYPAFGGLEIFVNMAKVFTFGSSASGYNDINRTNFEADTQNISNVSWTSSTRWSDWYNWLKANCWEDWLNWRCEQIHGQIITIADKLTAKRPGLKLRIHLQPQEFDTIPFYLDYPHAMTEWYRGAGLDFSMFSSDSNIEISYVGKSIYGRGRDALKDDPLSKDYRTTIIAPEIVSDLSVLSEVGARFQDYYWEYTFGADNPLDLSQLTTYQGSMEMKKRVNNLNPRTYLYGEHSAAAMNNLDPVYFTRGGYTLGMNASREYALEFAKAFVTLPAIKFDEVTELDDPIRVRQKTVDDVNYFYLINRCPSPSRITLNFSGTPTITDLVTQRQTVTDGTMFIELKPYELKTYNGGVVTGGTAQPDSEFVSFVAGYLDAVEGYFNGSPPPKAAPYYNLALTYEADGDYAKVYQMLQESWNPIVLEWKMPTVLSFNPSHDAYVRHDSADTNFGSETELRVRYHDTKSIYSYLKFDVTGLTQQVQSAKLKLYSNDVGMNVDVKSVADTSWDESLITWNNAPTAGGLLDSAGVSPSSWTEFDVTSYAAGNGTYSFRLEGDMNYLAQDFSSKEGVSNIPVLEFTFVTPTPTPTPSTLSFNPSDDAFVLHINPDINNGSSSELRVRGGVVRNTKSYLKFVVSGGVGTVQSAKLKLYSNDVAMYVDAKAVSDTEWTESNITWNNAPAMGSTLDTEYAGISSWVEFDVTPHITGNGIFSIGLTGDMDEAARDFLSKDAGGNIPILEVIFSN